MMVVFSIQSLLHLDFYYITVLCSRDHKVLIFKGTGHSVLLVVESKAVREIQRDSKVWVKRI